MSAAGCQTFLLPAMQEGSSRQKMSGAWYVSHYDSGMANGMPKGRFVQKIFFVRADWDEARVWVATSDDVPGLATEARTFEALAEKLSSLIPELLAANDIAQSAGVPFELLGRRFVVTQAAGD